MSKSLILVVEDDAILRFAAVAMVQSAGYATLQAGSADEALDLLQANNCIRAVFTDINMPGSINGMRLAGIVRDRWPRVEVIVTSGQTVVREDDLPVRGRFLPKPYTSEQIERLLRDFDLG